MGRRRRTRKNPDWSEAEGPGDRFYSYEGDALDVGLSLHLERDPKDRRSFWAALTTPGMRFRKGSPIMETVKGKFLYGSLAEAKKEALAFALDGAD